MMLDLVSRNASMRSLHVTLPGAVFVGLILIGLSRAAAGTAPGSVTIQINLLLLLWLLPAATLVVPASTRSSHFELTLPISARRLWLGHVAAVALSGLVTLAVAVAVPLVGRWATGGEAAPGRSLAWLGLDLGVGYLLALALLQSPRPALQRIPFTKGYVAYAVLVLLGTPVLVFCLSETRGFFALVALAATGVLGLHTYRALPNAFTLVSRVPEGSVDSDVAGQARRAATRDGSSSAALLVTLWRLVLGWPGLIFLLPIILAGLLLSGVFPAEDLRPMAVLYVLYMLLFWVTLSATRLRLVDPLPISRRRVFAMVMIPAALAIVVGYAAGVQLATRGEDAPAIAFRQPRGAAHHVLVVPARFLRVSWHGEPPAIGSPWGESHAPWKTPLLKGIPVALYSPYTTPPDSSVSFVALQISRAVETVHGRAILPEEIEDRYLELDSEGRVVPTGGALGLYEDHPGLAVRGYGSRSLVALLLMGGLAAVTLPLVLRIFRVVVRSDVRAFSLGLAFVMLASSVVLLAAFVADFAQPWVLGGFLEILARDLAAAAMPTRLGVWAVGAVVLVLGYRLAETQFALIEAPPFKEARQELMRQVGLDG